MSQHAAQTSQDWLCFVFEYKQLAMGSKFFLQSCKALVFHLIYGGIYVGEHPAPPADGNRPTIWRSALVQLLLQHPDVCLHVVPQWLWGAGAIKPTGLITVRLPYFKKDMYDNQVPFAIKPTAPIIGRFKDGTFKTSEHKEYPGAFCKALAFCFLNRLKHDYRNGKCTERTEALPEEAHEWFLEARGASTEIRAEAQWLPDFQGWGCLFSFSQLWDNSRACICGSKRTTLLRPKWNEWMNIQIDTNRLVVDQPSRTKKEKNDMLPNSYPV